jgi:putative heme-binding domain-containing protein
VLQLYQWGERPDDFPWLEAPREDSVATAVRLLEQLGALRNNQITELGSRMGKLPVSPRLARMLIESQSLGQTESICLVAAMISERDPFLRERSAPGRGKPPTRQAFRWNCDVTQRLLALQQFYESGVSQTPFGEIHRGAAHTIRKVAAQFASTIEESSPATPAPSMPRPVRNVRSRGTDRRLVRESSESEVSRLPLPEKPSRPRYSLDGAAPDQLLASPKSALLLARKLGLGELNPNERDALLTAAAKLPTGPVRDLFEGYLPAGEKGQRKLGSNPRPTTILAFQGDAGRGEKLFWSQAVNCGKCHRVGNRGTAIGPDLSTVGKLRSTEDLLDSLLSPSRRIEPKYAQFVVHTGDGRSLTGLLVKRDENSVVLRDGEGKEIIVAAENVEELRPMRTSLMPDGQMADLTAQEAADLLEYLATHESESSPNSQ